MSYNLRLYAGDELPQELEDDFGPVDDMETVLVVYRNGEVVSVVFEGMEPKDVTFDRGLSTFLNEMERAYAFGLIDGMMTDKEQVYKDMAWEMARELGVLLHHPVTNHSHGYVLTKIKYTGYQYWKGKGVGFGEYLHHLVSVDVYENTVDISWLSPQEAVRQNILDNKEGEEYRTFLDVNKFKTKEED